ncbi:unconventional myosin-XIX-like isoform X2 [Mercenaria mercenaria]|uniref:unconventional myosin-XIX-like isoform X2 n=1 Tax=Mercenaria mercenaria TaxID=6596 RepID=UPI00234FA766|nr:unconventional myosin-XIX-like isoform X2 [Mercenaria mercenaria]
MRSKDDINSFLPGMSVFVRDTAKVWQDGTVSSVGKSTCTVALTNKKETREYPVHDILQRSEQCLKTVNSLTDLSPINQASVLSCLQERFDDGRFYTNAGSTIVAVNPFQNVDNLYTIDTVIAYHRNLEDDPHIYKVGNEAYTRLCRELGHVNQCIIVSGESGSGKTVSAKHLLRFMTVVSNLSVDEQLKTTTGVCQSVEQKILDSNPILEAFGNAVTQRNDNSSRFGKFIQLQFSRGGHMIGAEIKTYLLEKTRVVHQLKGEANFHIFYQVMDSLSKSEGTILGQLVQEMGRDAFKVLPVGKNIDTNRDLEDTLKAMTQIGIPEEMQGEITKVLVAILFLCNVEIKHLEDELCQLLQEKVTETSLKQAGDLLGLEPSHMEQVLLYRHIESGGNKRRSVFVKPVPQREAYSRRDCLATLLYSRLFEWLVGFINTQIQGVGYDHTIGLLDIYGFEAFETNSLEQLCINYANEKLQQHYVKHFLKDLQKEYEDECIDWQHLSYCDNQPCLEILEGQPSVFGLLNEDVQLNRKTDTTHLCERILQLSQSSSSYVKRPKHFMKNPGFIVTHFAGDVTYTGDGLSTKNRDNIPQELVCMLRDSKNKFISELFDKFVTEEQHGRKRKTVLGKFKASLDCLMSSLKTSDVHYIRCIKPNTRSVSCEFDRQYVMSQLTASGIIETVKISSLGYPVRIPYPMFLQRYGLIIRNAKTPPQSEVEDVSDNDTLYDPLDALYRKQLHMVMADSPKRSSTPRRRLRRRAGLSSADHTRRCSAAVLTIQFGRCQGLTQQFGRTKLFLHQHQVDSLEQRRYDIISSKAAVLQRAWRRYRRRCAVRRENTAAVKIQSTWRKYIQHKHSKAVILLQKTFRLHIARKRYREMVQKKKQEKHQKKKKSWKPILDRKRTSPGTGRSSRSSERSDGSIDGLQESECIVLSANTSSDTSSSVAKSDQRTENRMNSFTTSTPRCENRRSPKWRQSREQCQEICSNKENIERMKRNPRGRPDMSKYSPVKTLRSYSKISAMKRSNSSSATETGSGDQSSDSGASPRKRQKMTDSSGHGAFHLQNGILTKRCLPKMPVRFHTRASVLKYAHYMHQKEMPSGLGDCLPDDQLD